MAQVRIIGCAYSSPAGQTSAQLATAQVAAIQGLRNSAQAAGRRPGIVLSPGLGTNATGAAEPNAAALAALALQLKAIAIVDATPNTIALSGIWNINNGAPRVLAIPQKITTPVKRKSQDPRSWPESWLGMTAILVQRTHFRTVMS